LILASDYKLKNHIIVKDCNNPNFNKIQGIVDLDITVDSTFLFLFH